MTEKFSNLLVACEKNNMKWRINWRCDGNPTHSSTHHMRFHSTFESVTLHIMRPLRYKLRCDEFLLSKTFFAAQGLQWWQHPETLANRNLNSFESINVCDKMNSSRIFKYDNEFEIAIYPILCARSDHSIDIWSWINAWTWVTSYLSMFFASMFFIQLSLN